MTQCTHMVVVFLLYRVAYDTCLHLTFDIYPEQGGFTIQLKTLNGALEFDSVSGGPILCILIFYFSLFQ